MPSRTRRTKSVASLSQSGRAVIEQLSSRLQQLESQFFRVPTPHTGKSLLPPQPTDETNDFEECIEETIKGVFDSQDVAADSIVRSWNDFMNKDGKQTKEFAIEILEGEPDYYHPSKVIEKAERTMGKETIEIAKRTTATPSTAPPKDASQHPIPDRIRINSPLILSVLNNIDRHIDATGSTVFLRPFKVFVFHEERIRDMIARLEFQTQEPYQSEQELAALKTTLEHMKCLADFMDHRLLPHVNRIMNPATTKICFRDLWYIFRPGEDVYMALRRLRGAVFKGAMDATPETFRRRYHMLWRVTGTGGGRPNISRSQDHEPNVKPNPFKVNCYYLDYDGKLFLPITHTFTIMPWIGERDINNLELYPIRYMKNGQERLRDVHERGRANFRTIATGFKHYYYSGLTMVTQPCGCALQKEPMHQEYIESEVIVDYRSTMLKHPSWRPKPAPWKKPPQHDDELQERCCVQYFADIKNQRRVVRTEQEYVHDDHHVDRELSRVFRDHEQILSPVPSGWASNAEMVPEKDVGLLAGRVFAFVLRTRSFSALWLLALSPIEKQRDSLNNLQLRDNGCKETIQKLVDAHFKQANSGNDQVVEYDIIQGKGRGLVILLHGAPGVGKTSTAESVAAASGKPLFQITSADLGTDPMSVEKALKQIFRYAQTWNCVLLLDECDVFLAQRTKNDVLRNGLVSGKSIMLYETCMLILHSLSAYSRILYRCSFPYHESCRCLGRSNQVTINIHCLLSSP